MAKVIEIINNGYKYYYISHNPNNGNCEVTSNIENAAIFNSIWEMGFINKIKNIIRYSYPIAKINAVHIKN